MGLQLRASSLAAIALWLSIGVVRAASAQQAYETGTDDRTRLGPPKLASVIEVTSGVDTNVFNAADQPKSDFVWTLSPKAAATLRLGPAQLTVNGVADFVYFQQIASERSVNLDGSMKLVVPLNRVRPFVSGSFLRTRQRPSVEVDTRSLRHEQSVSVGTTVRLSDRTSVEGAGTISKVAFDEGAVFYDTYLQEVFNRTTRKVAFSVRHRLTSLTTMTMAVEAMDERFQLSPVRNSTSIRVAPEFEFDSSALISGKASVGYRTLHAQDASMPDFKGAVASAELAYTLLGTTRFLFQANRDVEYSYEIAAPYYVISGVGGGIIQQITDSMGITARGMHYQLSFRSIAANQPDSRPRSDDTLEIAGAGVLYKIGRDLRVSINADYYHRLSPLLLRQYSGLRVGSSVVYGF